MLIPSEPDIKKNNKPKKKGNIQARKRYSKRVKTSDTFLQVAISLNRHSPTRQGF